MERPLCHSLYESLGSNDSPSVFLRRATGQPQRISPPPGLLSALTDANSSLLALQLDRVATAFASKLLLKTDIMGVVALYVVFNQCYSSGASSSL